MLRADSVACAYGQAIAVENVSLTVERGEVTALLGPNGAGKSSVIMTIAGHLACRAGSIHLDDEDVTGIGPIGRTRRGIAIVPEGRRIFPDLTVAENLLVGGYLHPRAVAKRNEESVFTLFPRLEERRGQRAGTLSGGEQQMLAIGRALMTDPKVLLVDELSLGLMPAMVDLCIGALEKLRARNVSILLVEQNTTRALAIADRVVVLSSGLVAYAATGPEARENATLLESYLGT